MKEHIFLPKPVFPRHVCFPDFIGGYSEYPEHSVRREYATKENNLDRCYNMHLVLDGKGFLHTETGSYELTRGQGFLYGPGLRQTYHSDSDQPWNIRWVHFYGGRLEELLGGKGLDEPWLFGLSDPAPVVTLIERLLHLGRAYEVNDEYAMASTLYELLTRIQSMADQLNVPVNPAADRIRAAANYVRAHCHEPFTLEQAAAIAGYSPHYFSRKFSRTFGQSFPEFLMESRILQAKRLLASTGLSVKLIALQTGFSQTSYFGRCFRTLEGMTPLEFRHRHQV
ncbi:AraC family transcriptional regulator [Paenibacillus sp. S-38]|uniref:helix-turn-helix transcriptional regulator n=1 Tax=Paenibacillus sp. S-38 TaxID=3416710 RepID=UPI003CEEFCD2